MLSDEGDDDEKRADAYMNAFQPTLASCPWFPVVGNHEYSGMELARYLNSTWEQWAPLPLNAAAKAMASGLSTANGSAVDVAGAKDGATTDTNTNTNTDSNNNSNSNSSTDAAMRFHSTATSALGYFLSTGNYHAAGKHSPQPSGSSRYFSSDIGMVHMVALDFNLYYGCDACGERCKEAQLAWFEKDLQAAVANRNAVPWIIATSHFPVFCTGCAGNGEDSAAYYASPDAEYFGNSNSSAAAAYDSRVDKPARPASSPSAAKLTSRGASASLVADYAPLLKKYGVDLFMAGS